MLHGYEEATIAPAMSIYDSGLMQLFIAAARELYQQGLKDLDDFYKQYGDFLSPSAADTDYYYNNTVGRVRDALNDALAHGIDLTRSAEGRAYLANLVRNVPYSTLAAMRLNAKKLEAWQTLAALMKANGTYGSDDYLRYVNGGVLPSDFSTIDKNGNVVMFENDAPTKFLTLKEATDAWFNSREPYTLSPELAKKMLGNAYDARYDYTGFTDEDLLDIASNNTPGWESSPIGKWYRHVAELQVAARTNGNYTQEDVEKLLLSNVATANKEYKINPKRTANEYAKLDYAYTQDMNKLKLQHKYTMEELGAKGGSKSGSGTGSGSGSGGSGEGNETIPGMLGVNGLLSMDLLNRYNERVQKYYNEYNKSGDKSLWNKQLAAYNKLSNTDKVKALAYARAYDYVNAIKTSNKYGITNSADPTIKIFMAKFESDPKFKSWRDAFVNRRNARELYVANKFTTEGNNVGGRYGTYGLVSKSALLWSENYEVHPSAELAKLINGTTNYQYSKLNINGTTTGYYSGNMRGKKIATIQQQRDTGTRRMPNADDGAMLYKLQRLISNSNFTINQLNFARRRYAKVKGYNEYLDYVTIKISGKNMVDGKTDYAYVNANREALQKYGIDVKDSTKKGEKGVLYITVPVISKYKIGQREADQDNRSLKDVAGTSYVSQYGLNNQAMYLTVSKYLNE